MSEPPPRSTVRMREKDAHDVYFCENSSLTSFSGYIDDDSAMSEQEIAEYIRYSNPKLYEKLHGVRYPSSYLPCDGDDGCSCCCREPSDDGAGHDDDDDGGGESGLVLVANQETSCASPLLRETDSKNQHGTESSDAADCPSEPDLICTSSPRSCPAAAPIVIDRYHFTFYQHCEPGTVYCCASPTCPSPRNVIPLGNYFGIIRDTASGQENDKSAEYNRLAYYCLDCLDEMVDREEQLGRTQEVLAQLVDGAQPDDRNVILHKALEIYPDLPEKAFFFVRVPSENGPEIGPGDASNSKKVIRIRRQKQLEIHRITQDLKQQQLTALYRMYERNNKPDPSGLRIPVLLESQPYRERYKKQGLEWNHRFEGSEARKACSDESIPATNKISVPRLKAWDVPVCYCREPADGGPLLHCQSASCMLGPFHFRCSGLVQLPLDTESYWCAYCMSNSTVDTEQICGDGVLGNCTSKTENYQDGTNMETDGEDFRSAASGDEEEEDIEIQTDLVPSAACGFVAVNHVSP